MNKFKILSALSILAIAVGCLALPLAWLNQPGVAVGATRRQAQSSTTSMPPTGSSHWPMERGLQLRLRGRTAGRAADLPEKL